MTTTILEQNLTNYTGFTRTSDKTVFLLPKSSEHTNTLIYLHGLNSGPGKYIERFDSGNIAPDGFKIVIP